MLLLRLIPSIPLAALITLVLFYFMQALIATGDQIEQSLRVIRIIDATMPEILLEVIEEIERPAPIEELAEEMPDIPDKDITLGSGANVNIGGPVINVDNSIQIDNAIISATDGDFLPLVRFPPQYPTRALRRGIEGWSLMEFTVNGIGNVVEESIVVIDGEPENIFDRSSSKAVARFKYQPRVIDGQGVDVPNVRTVIRYEIEAN